MKSMTSTFGLTRPGTGRGMTSGGGVSEPSGANATAAPSFSIACASWRKSSSASSTSPSSEKTT